MTKRQPKPKHPNSRQQVDPQRYRDIIERIAQGESVASICRSKGMPTKQAFFDWVNNEDGALDLYARAKEAGMEVMAEDALQIADAAEGQDSAAVNAARLRVDTRKWLMSKLAPKRWGDKMVIDQTSRVEAMTDDQLLARIKQLDEQVRPLLAGQDVAPAEPDSAEDSTRH